jgi:hypothetical protein
MGETHALHNQRFAAAKKGQKVIKALMGSFIGSILVVSSAIAPSIQNGIESTKTSKRNFLGDLSWDML